MIHEKGTQTGGNSTSRLDLGVRDVGDDTVCEMENASSGPAVPPPPINGLCTTASVDAPNAFLFAVARTRAKWVDDVADAAAAAAADGDDSTGVRPDFRSNGDAPPPPEVKAQIVSTIQKNIDIMKVAGWGLVDDVIDPRDTRKVLAMGLELARHKRVERPARKRGVIPV